jgi:Clustered mitochondria
LAYAKIIISELFLPLERKTFQPLVGATGAGGDKYVIHDVLFKITQKNRLYTSHEAASKVPSHELKGIQAYLNCGLQEFSLPLLAIVDFRG